MPVALLKLLPQVQNATQFSTIKFESSTSFFLFHNVQSQRRLVIIHFKTQISENILDCVEAAAFTGKFGISELHLGCSSGFFYELLFVLKWLLSIGRCRKSSNHPLEDLAKSGYKPNMKYQASIILLATH
jgi:hypothetical protein